MAIVYGVTSVGFVSKPADQIATEIDAALQTILGASAGTEPDGTIPLDTFAGQLKSLLVDFFSANWDLAQAVYSSFDPNSATGAAQDAIGAITATERDPAIASTATVTLTGTPLTVVTAGNVAIVNGTGSRFDTLTDATIVSVSNWAASTSYAVGTRVTNVNQVYQVVTAGTSAGSVGPNITAAGQQTDGSVVWMWLGAGTGAIDVVAQAETTGAIAAIAGSLNQIGTPVGGWSNVINVLDAIKGQDQESDFAFRVRRDEEVSADAAATYDAIRAAILAIVDTTNPIVSCAVFYNDQNTSSGAGLPPHSVNVVVLGLTNQEVANAIFATIGAGITTYGGTSVTVTDSSGKQQTVNFDRPTAVPVYIVANVTYDPTTFPNPPSAGAVLIQEALALYAENPLNYPVGKSVRASALEAQVFDGPVAVGGSPVPGVLDVSSLFIGTAANPSTSTTIAIGNHQVATFDTTRMVVNLTPGTP